MSDETIAAAFITATLNANAGLLAQLPGGIHWGKAPTGAAFPNVTFFCMSGVDWNGATAAVYMADENRWAVYINTKGLTIGGAYKAIAKAIHSTLYCVTPVSVSVDGDLVLGCTRNGFPPSYPETVDGQDYTHIGVGFYDLVTQDAAMAALSGL